MTDNNTAPTREETVRVLGDIMHVDNGHLKMSSLLPWWLAEAEAAVDFLTAAEGLPHLAALASKAGMVTEDSFRDFDAVHAWADSETVRANEAEAALAAETEHRIGLLVSNESLVDAVYETQALLDKERARTERVRALVEEADKIPAPVSTSRIRAAIDGEEADHGPKS